MTDVQFGVIMWCGFALTPVLLAYAEARHSVKHATGRYGRVWLRWFRAAVFVTLSFPVLVVAVGMLVFDALEAKATRALELMELRLEERLQRSTQQMDATRAACEACDRRWDW